MVDSQSTKVPAAEQRGFDAGKKVVGRKRHIAVDTDGRLLMVNLTTAEISDSAGVQSIVAAIRKRWPWLKHLFADGAYDRTRLMDPAAYRDFVIEIVRRTDKEPGFKVRCQGAGSLFDRVVNVKPACESSRRRIVVVSAVDPVEPPRQSIDERFAAFEGEAKKLTPADRRTLLASIRDAKAPAFSTPTKSTASRWAIWRSRLPYRVAGLASLGTVVALGLVAALLARSRTPELAVQSRYQEPLEVEFRTGSGLIVANRLMPGQRYGLERREGDVAVLRLWTQDYGYAHARVPTESLVVAVETAPRAPPRR